MTSTATTTRYVGALDNGTTSTRFILYRIDRPGVLTPVSSHQVEHAQTYPKPGWCEHDPEEIFANALTCMERACARGDAPGGGVDATAIECVGIANQRETVVAWDARTGECLHNAIVWLDTRTREICDELIREAREDGADTGADRFRESCGLPINTYFSAGKMRWLLENSARVREANENGTLKFGTIDSWLVHRLTNGARHVTDVTNASRTMLMDLRTTRWRKDTCDAFQVNVESLPEILSSADNFGAIALGYLRGVKITAALGDQHAATLGQRCRPGEAKCTYGTGCFMVLNTGRHVATSEHGLLTTVAWRLKPSSNPKRARGDDDSSEDAPRNAPECSYALEGSVAIAGAGVQWLRDNLGIIRSTSDVEPLAGSVDDAAGVVFVPAFTGLFAPRWKQNARGVIVGLTQHSTAAHIARALLDAICFQVKDVLDAMIADVCRRPGESGYVGKNSDQLKSTASFSMPNVVRVDGGATANALLMQTQADVLGMEISRPRDVETTALGAALAAGIGAGLWSEEDVFAREGDFERVGDGDDSADETATTTFEPRTTAEERAKRFALWCDAVGRSFGLARE